MQDTEALFFVDDHEAKILKNDIAGNEAMGADHDVDPAFAQQLQNFLLLRLRTKPTQHFDANWIIQHSLAKGFEMLLRQNSGRCQNRDLFTVHYRLECSANRHFCLTKANIATNESIHWPRALHITFRLDDGLELVRRFAVGKGMLKFCLPFCVAAEGVT